jgi:hypothetical protein
MRIVGCNRVRLAFAKAEETPNSNPAPKLHLELQSRYRPTISNLPMNKSVNSTESRIRLLSSLAPPRCRLPYEKPVAERGMTVSSCWHLVIAT